MHDDRITLIIIIKKVSTKIHQKCPREFTQKIISKIHPKRKILVLLDNSVSLMITIKKVHGNNQKCPQKFDCYVHENSANPLEHASTELLTKAAGFT